MALIAAGFLGDATVQVADRVLALSSPLAASPERGEIGRLVLWCLIWVGACGLLLRRNWGRRLLLAMVAARTLGIGYTSVQVLAGSSPDAFGWALALGVILFYPALLVILFRAHVLTPVPALPPSRSRAAAVLCLAASALGVVLLDRFLPTDAADLTSLPVTAQGELEPLLHHTRWRGERVKLVAMREGKPVTQRVADWDLKFAQVGEGTVLIQGLHFAQNVTIKVDIARNAMLIHDVLFEGRPITGKSPLFGDLAFRGVSFEGEGSRINGRASILVLEDGRVALDFDRVFIDGRRSHEYGSAAPDPSSATSLAPVDSTRPVGTLKGPDPGSSSDAGW